MRRGCYAVIWAAACGLVMACGSPQQPVASNAPPASSVVPSPDGAPASPSAGSESTTAPAIASCGGLECRLFDSPELAFRAVLAEHPAILGIGEAHAQKGTEAVASTTERFTRDLLPLLQGRASDLVVELWAADKKCAAPKVAAVAKKQEAVTTSQASGNQNEFVALGHASKALGITPHILRPTCEEYDAILNAGDDAVLEMLAMITRLTRDKVQALSQAAGGGTEATLVVAYGGAMHNDLRPKEGREGWSFGPELMEWSKGRYVELDLIVPEYIKDNDAWRALPWFEHYDGARYPGKTLLFKPVEGSYVLVFPKQSP